MFLSFLFLTFFNKVRQNCIYYNLYVIVKLEKLMQDAKNTENFVADVWQLSYILMDVSFSYQVSIILQKKYIHKLTNVSKVVPLAVKNLTTKPKGQNSFILFKLEIPFFWRFIETFDWFHANLASNSDFDCLTFKIFQ